MSDLETRAALQTNIIKKSFPNPAGMINKMIQNVPTTWVTGNPCTQTDAGAKSITLTPLSYDIKVCFDAANDTIAAAGLNDATVDSATLQYIYIKAGQTRTLNFTTAITRWDMKAITTQTNVFQEVAR